MSELQNIVDMTGKWPAQAESWDFNTAGTGTPQIVVTFRITNGPHHGHKAIYFGSFSDKAQTRTLESLRHAGWQGDDLAAITELPTEVELDIELQEYEGKWSNKVKWVNRGGRMELKNAMGDDQLRAFAEKMRGAAVASRSKAGAPAPQAQARPAAPRPYTPPQKRPAPSAHDGREAGDPGPSDQDLGF